jgi:diguanylate cyclase (GGDEF)-like protein/PAS domain S-box-containing protein
LAFYADCVIIIAVPIQYDKESLISPDRILLMTHPLPYKEILDNLYDGVYFVDPNRRITYWNEGAERISGFTTEEVLGHSCADNLLVHIDEQGTQLCKSLCPLAKTLQDGEKREAEVYLHHAEGYRVPVLVRVTPLRDEQGNITGAVEVFSDNSSLMAALKRLQEMRKVAIQDPLTGVGNRRHIASKMKTILDELRQHQLTSGLLFIDIDHFKEINDTHGHEAGDRVLQMIANTLRHNIRTMDFLGRWGGEEFVVLLLNVEKEQLAPVANKLRMLVENSYLKAEQGRIQVTVSIGVTLTRLDDTPKSLLRRADKLMYRSKREGRNRVTVDE